MTQKFLIYSLALFFIMGSLGCNKEKKKIISYPVHGSYGENVLALPSGTILTNVNGYSLCAELGKEAVFKIKITQISGSGLWFYSGENGWLVSSFSNGSQLFESNSDEKNDLHILFENGPGACRIDYYENASSITNSKTFSW